MFGQISLYRHIKCLSRGADFLGGGGPQQPLRFSWIALADREFYLENYDFYVLKSWRKLLKKSSINPAKWIDVLYTTDPSYFSRVLLIGYNLNLDR